MRHAELPLAERLTALRDGVEAADGRLPLADLQPARDLLAKAGARIALGEATVVALAGATGSGKSTLFNALAGQELSAPGVRRPTTGTAHACVWGEEGTPQLLDWLGVPRRHVQPDPDPALDGLVLLDLPDHDSTAVQHRLEVDRLVQLVDVLVWVLDPQKYADAAVHDRYLRPHAEHAGVLVVVLNQVDRLDPVAREACVGDLRRLLDVEGLGRTPVVPVSARTGEGVPELRAVLAERVRARRALSDRLTADVREVAGSLGSSCTGTAGEVRKADRKALVAALADAAGVPVVEAAVERSVRGSAVATTGWPPVRWLRRLRADPLRRLHLGGTPDERIRTSLAPASGAQRAGVTDAVRRVRDAAGSDLAPGWRDSLRETLAEREADLPDRLDRAVAGTDLGVQRRPRWWSLVGGLQWLLLAVALVGAGWLLALAALGFAQLDEVLPMPRVGGLPLPTLLLVAGLLGGALLAVLVRPFVRAGARRRGRRAGDRLRERVQEVARTEVLAPVEDSLAAHQRWCAALTRAGA
jgi:GTP-binding protein EngB required for normal cell division